MSEGETPRPEASGGPPGTPPRGTSSGPPPADAPPESAPPAAAADRNGSGEAYQAAGRVSPWGYVFLGGLFMLVMGVVWMKVERETGPVTWGWIAIALALTLAPFAWHCVDWFPALTGRRGQAGGFVFLTLGLGVLVFGFASAVNVLKKDDQRWNPTYDTTRNGRFTLGDESRRILDSLPDGSTVHAIYLEHTTPQTDLSLRNEAQEQLRVFARSSTRVRAQFLDAFRERAAVERAMAAAGVAGTNSGEDVDLIVLSYAEPGKEVASGKQKEVRVESFTFAKPPASFDSAPKWLGERVIAGAIFELVFQRYKVYATGGHGEKALGDELRTVRDRLAAQNLEVVDRPLVLATQGKVPDDCDLLLIAGPATPFSAEEAKAIEAWLAPGKSLFVMLDADPAGRRETGLETVLAGFGVEPRINYLVVSPRVRRVTLDDGRQTGFIEMAAELAPGIEEYAEHPAVRAIRSGSGFSTRFVNSSFVQVNEDPLPGVQADPVVHAPELPREVKEAPRPFAARIEPGRRDWAVPQEGKDKVGSRLPLVVAATRSPQGAGAATRNDARLVVSGDTDAFSDSVTREYGPNLDLFSGLVQWSLRREELVAVSDRTLEMELVDLDDRKQRMAFWVPFASTTTALLAGAAVWWARRR